MARTMTGGGEFLERMAKEAALLLGKGDLRAGFLLARMGFEEPGRASKILCSLSKRLHTTSLDHCIYLLARAASPDMALNTLARFSETPFFSSFDLRTNGALLISLIGASYTFASLLMRDPALFSGLAERISRGFFCRSPSPIRFPFSLLGPSQALSLQGNLEDRRKRDSRSRQYRGGGKRDLGFG